MPSECSTMYQIGMKDQRIAFRLIRFPATIDTRYLSRCKKNQCPLLIIICMAAIYQIAALYLFQKNGIEAKIHPGTLTGVCLRQINNAHQRMQGFVVVECIILIYGFKPAHRFHIDTI
ncbi:hypothetical protein D3C86_1050980 [compost metagenome]